ncbi:hypothetical protein N431DRAFT_418205 [Stipitochalara longipes BDJ]|nr:hypothetical protein N431DRAFT_418205 [Stipitochalara longipes BDJ]
MASTSSKNKVPIRDKDKAVRAAQGGGVGGGARGRDIPTREGLIHSSRTPRRSNPYKPEPSQPIIVNFNGDVQITKGSMFGRSPDEGIEQLRRARQPTTPIAYGEAALQRSKPRHIIAIEDEEAEAEFEDFESDGEYTLERELSQPPSASRSRAAPRSAQRVQTGEDSGYSGSTQGSKREKNEAYRASLNRRSPDGSSIEEGPSRTKRKAKPPSIDSNGETGATPEDNETQLATQGDDGGDNGDDSDDDFERRLMKVATHDNNQLDVHVILDTGTKPDWISSRFLTEKLGMKFTRLNDEENKQEFSDFNGNKFNPIGRAELMISSTDFAGFSCRRISFLVNKGGTFQILLGSKTIKKEKLLCKPEDPEREGAFPAVQTAPKKAERAVIIQNKEKQSKEGAERDKLREEARKAKMKERMEAKSSSSGAARLAQESKPHWMRENSTSPSPSPSPSRNARYPVSKGPMSSWRKTKVPVNERSSSSSLSGGGAAIYD